MTSIPEKKIPAGFSLIELLIYVAILSVILVLVISIFLTMSRIRSTANAKVALNENARLILGRVRDSIYDASSATLGGSCINNALTLSVGGTDVTYRITGSTFEIVDGANPAKSLNSPMVRVSGAGSCLFAKLTNPAPSKPTVRINLRLTYDTPGNPLTELTQDYELTVALRQ